MNKFYFSALMLIFGATSALNAQAPNPSFENWTSGEPDGWTSLNYASPTDEDGNPMDVVEQITDGSSYMKISSYNVINSTNPTEFPDGVYGSYVYQEFLSSTKHLEFSVDVNYNLKPNDTTVVMVSAIDIDKNVIGQGIKRFGGTQSELSSVLIEMSYSIFFEEPVHSYVVGISSSETRALGQLYDSTAAIGSWIGVDNIIPGDLLSVPKEELANTKIKIYPNPASDVVNFDLDELNNGTITINSVTGQEVVNTKFTNGTKKINVNHLNNGVYIYTVRNQNRNVVKTGKLIIRK